MALILKKILQGYFWLFNDVKDSRSDHLFLMSSPFQPALIAVAYLYLVLRVLPEFMKNRPPYKLDNILIAYNLTQVVVNAYIFYHGFSIQLDWYCMPLDFSDTPQNRFILKLVYMYFLTKLMDLLDTIFFILRGKTNQVSFLHVYHHFGMISLAWVGTRFFAGGHSLFLGLANTFVHIVMYSYYLVTVWKPEYQRYIWWKKYITQLQLIQFVFFFVTYGQVLLRPDCAYPKFPSYLMVTQNLFMIALFSHFYWKTYVKERTRKVQ